MIMNWATFYLEKNKKQQIKMKKETKSFQQQFFSEIHSQKFDSTQSLQIRGPWRLLKIGLDHLQQQIFIFNRLRAIWSKGYQRGSLRKSHQNGNFLKASNAKKLSSRKNRTCSLRITGPLLWYLQPSDYSEQWTDNPKAAGSIPVGR